MSLSLKTTSLNEYRCKPANVFIARTDTRAEIDLVCELAKRAGAFDAVPCYHWSIGGKGSVDLAWAVREAASKRSRFQFLYDVQVRSRRGDSRWLTFPAPELGARPVLTVPSAFA